jgi:hypothetical protein
MRKARKERDPERERMDDESWVLFLSCGDSAVATAACAANNNNDDVKLILRESRDPSHCWLQRWQPMRWGVLPWLRVKSPVGDLKWRSEEESVRREWRNICWEESQDDPCLCAAESMRRVQEYLVEKKISRYPCLQSQDTRIYVQKKESMMRRVQELPTGKKSQDTHLKILASLYRRKNAWGLGRVMFLSVIPSAALYSYQWIVCVKAYIHAYNIPFHSKGKNNGTNG